MDITTIIESFGFPIAVTIACGWFVFRMYTDSTKQNAEREERNFEMLSKFEVSISKFADILSGYESKLGIIEEDVKYIKDKIK